MRQFNIDEYKRNPRQPIILKKYNKPNQFWMIEKADVTIGDQLVIEVPETGYDVPPVLMLTDPYEVRDLEENIVGYVCFAWDKPHIKTSLYDFAIKLLELKEKEIIDFVCNNKATTLYWGASKIHFLDMDYILLCPYGGRSPHVFPFNGFEPAALKRFLRKKLPDLNGKYVYIENTPKVTPSKYWSAFKKADIPEL